ncbi:MAG: enoyl-CoA hydratase/isomerase family protein [Alphaproteobacteria bacterium]|nr:enoyl-CoA hydratase/isomerase family protein [Alphaproteobacteria bacterium]
MPVSLDISDGLATLTFDAPPANAVDIDFTEALIARLDTLRAMSGVGAAIVTGAGRAFCAGVNLKVVPGYDAEAKRVMVGNINRMASALYALPFPVVAAVNGPAIGGGMVLAMACDFRVAAREHARFALAEVAANIPYPAVPLIVLEDSLDPSVRRDLMLTGRILDANGATAMRIVDHVVEVGALLDAARMMATTLAKAPGYARVKAQLRAPALTRMRAVIERGDDPMLEEWI